MGCDPAEAQAINQAAEAAERMADEASKMTADIQCERSGSSSSSATLTDSTEPVHSVDGRRSRGSKQRPPGLSSLSGAPPLGASQHCKCCIACMRSVPGLATAAIQLGSLARGQVFIC